MSQRAFAVYTSVVCLTLALAQAVAAQTAPARKPAAKLAAELSAASQLSAADQNFLLAREAARNGERERLARLAPQLTSHPLVAYVDYWQLAARLRSTDPRVANEVDAFFVRYPNSYVADRLRLDWALALGERGDFIGFDAEARRLIWNTDDGQFRCFSALSRYRSAVGSQIELAAREARVLLANIKDSAGDGCMALTEALLADGRISVWDRVRALVEQHQLATAKRIGARALDAGGKPIDTRQLSLAIDQPTAFLNASERKPLPGQNELAIIAIVRLARDSPQSAADHAQNINLALSPEQRGVVWGRIGHMAALRLMPEANEWYRRGGELVAIGPDTARVDEVLEWQVRSALRAGDWAAVKSAIDRMPASLREDAAWQYWYGRALQAEGRPAEAQDHFRRIAPQFSFYGKLATEELGLPIALPARAPAPSPEELAPFAGNAGFARALKFYELGLRLEGNREWNWQLRGLNDRELLAAAEYARSLSILDRMINTSDRTRTEFDFNQRFPAPFRDSMVQYTTALGLDENWVYGLIRQESRFIQDARSSVGASGLMQLMPATARYVARKMNVPNFAPARVNELDLNLQLGTGYLKMVLDDLDNSPMLATAAYNAGPGRPRAWRATLLRPVEGAVFAETIPFNETRDYVKKVMSNSVYYAALANGATGSPLSLKARLGTISPKTAGTTELP